GNAFGDFITDTGEPGLEAVFTGVRQFEGAPEEDAFAFDNGEVAERFGQDNGADHSAAAFGSGHHAGNESGQSARSDIQVGAGKLQLSKTGKRTPHNSSLGRDDEYILRAATFAVFKNGPGIENQAA